MGLEGWKWDLQAGGKVAALTTAETPEPGALNTGEVRGMRGVAVKCMDITQNPDCEGSVPAGH